MADGRQPCARQLERTAQPSKKLVRNVTILTIALFAMCLTFKVMLLIDATTSPDQIDSVVGIHGYGVPNTRLVYRRQRSAKRRHPVVFPTGNGRCSSDHLGLPPIVAERCNSLNGSSAEFRKCSRLTCANLLTGNPARKRDAALYRDAIDFFPDQRVMKSSEHDHSQQAILGQRNDEEIINATSSPDDCAEFRRSRGFVDWVDADAADFPLAYNILVHANAKQIALLLRAIYRPNNMYCLHVDRRSPEHFQSAMRSLARCFHNVKLASKPVTVVYAGYSRLQADINCMKDHVNSSVKWKYLINTAGKMRRRTLKRFVIL
jgi:hypothetical protein